MYKKFAEKTNDTRCRGLTRFLISNPGFAAGCLILLGLVVGALWGFAVPKDRYAGSSESEEEHPTPPVFKPYILVGKATEPSPLDLDSGIPVQRSKSKKWVRKPVSYQLKPGEGFLLDTDGKPKVFSAHPFGTDSQGRDVFLRTLVSIGVYLLPSLIAIGLSFFLGILLGILGANMWTGRLASIQFLAQCLMDVLEALPKYITVLLAVILIPPEIRHFRWLGIQWHGFYWLSVVLGVLSAPKLGKLIMERIDIFKEREFIEAAEAMGMSKLRIAFRHIICYNCLPLLLTQASALVTDVILIEIVLNYLTQSPGSTWGLGITVHEAPSLGTILMDARFHLFGSARSRLFGSWWLAFFPLVTVLLWTSAAHMFTQGLSRILSRQRVMTELW